MSTLHFALPEVAATDAAGAALARALAPDLRGLITLEGDLGAGKTALARAVLRGLGVTGPVKSPTYTLVEPYVVVGGRVLHLDLYRLGGAGEWLGLGLEDDPPEQALWLVEWPDRAGGMLPPTRLAVTLTETADGGRRLALRWSDPRDPAATAFSIYMKNSV
jgi:tRNA threonylcarbamoyladenosine biosynthesis protein TsaE